MTPEERRAKLIEQMLPDIREEEEHVAVQA